MNPEEPTDTEQAFRRAAEQHRRHAVPSLQPPFRPSDWRFSRGFDAGETENALQRDLIVNGTSEHTAIQIVDSLRRLVHGNA